MKFPDDPTSGNIFGPAMEITDQAEADAWFGMIVDFVMKDRPCDRATAESITLQNLGYYSGYYGVETQRRVEKLFRTSHPIFGTVDGGRNLTANQALRLGGDLAEGKPLERSLAELDARPKLSVSFRGYDPDRRPEFYATVHSDLTREYVLTLLREGGFNVEEIKVIPEVYPLDWPGHWARTPGYKRKPSRFGKHGFGQIRDNLFDELRRLGARNVVLSTDIPVRLDGLPYANRAESGDPGAAVYFQWRGKPFVIAADSYRRTWENVKAIAKTIEAMRAIERHGASQILERAVAGFTALPPGSGAAPDEPPSRPWWEVLGMPKLEGISFTEIGSDPKHPMRQPLLKMAEVLYKSRIPTAHPDRGGTNEKMRELSLAVEQAREALT